MAAIDRHEDTPPKAAEPHKLPGTRQEESGMRRWLGILLISLAVEIFVILPAWVMGSGLAGQRGWVLPGAEYLTSQPLDLVWLAIFYGVPMLVVVSLGKVLARLLRSRAPVREGSHAPR
jgi:hypothetical protein